MNENEIIIKKLYDMDKRLTKLEEEIYKDKKSTLQTTLVQGTKKPTVTPTVHPKNIIPQTTPKPSEPPKIVKKEPKNLEMELGGKWINRVGIMALILAAAFFLKYSFDNNLIGPQGRILIGVLFGVSMLISGDLLFKKYRIPSEGLMGGGIAILCFTVFAAFAFYNLIGQSITFILFVLIILASTFLAIKNDTVTIMHLGVLTGFLTPFLLSSGETNDVFFLAYLVILNLGIVIISYYKNWKSLFNFAFFATHFCFLGWLIGRFVIDVAGVEKIQFFTGFLPLIVIFAEFLVISILMNLNLKNKKTHLKFDFFLIFINAIVFYAEGYKMLLKYNDSLLGIFTIVIALLYLGIYFGIRKFIDAYKNFLTFLLLVSLTFITIAIPVQLEGRFLSLAWAIEAFALSYLSTKTEYIKIYFSYIIVMIIALISLWVNLIYIGNDITKIPFLNINSIIYITSIVVLFGSLWANRKDKSGINIIFTVILNLFLIGFFLADTSNIFGRLIEKAQSLGQQEKIEKYIYMENLIGSLVVLLYSIILIFIGFIKNSKSMRILSLCLFILVIFKVFLFDLSSLIGIYRILSFMVLGVILIGISFIYQKYKNLILGEDADEA